MADVRSLLRQQRAARRITHPHAAYSDAGKLLCTLCREQVRTELLWEVHVLSPGHRQRVEKLEAEARDEGADGNATSNKRKHEDEDMDDVVMGNEDEDEAGSRKKRSRQEMGHGRGRGTGTGAEQDEDKTPPKRQTPPLPRRSSGTPSHGVEIQIPSRPATPVAVRAEASRTRSFGSVTGNRSPLKSQTEAHSVAGFVDSADPPAATAAAAAALATVTSTGPAAKVNEDEWAAFEADLLKESSAPARPAAAAPPAEAVISAPAMTAAELAARSAEEERTRRRAAADVELDDEKEDAARALETEFEDMEELEARVRRLKERREALRQRQGSPPSAADGGAGGGKPDAEAAAQGKENAQEDAAMDSEDDEDDEDADDWAGFRFRR